MITVEQRPLTLTPTGVEHVYNVSSPNTGNTDYRYVLDIYTNTTTSNPEYKTRLLVSPNTYGKGIVNVDRIVENFVTGNARSESPQYTSETTTGTTAYGIISNVKGFSTSNGFNDDTNYNKQQHVSDYRIMVGEQWTSGNTTVTYVSTASTTPGSTFFAQMNSGRIEWFGAGANIVEGSSLEKGVRYYYQSISGETTTEDGQYNPLLEPITPISGYTIEIVEKYSDIQYQFEYDGEQWNFKQIIYPSDYDPSLSPPAVTIYPGTSLEQGSYNPYVNNAPYWDTTEPTEQQNYWEVKKYRMSGSTVSEEEPSWFLTTAGHEIYYLTDSNPDFSNSRARRRYHHPSCPILLSWFYGILSSNTDFEFNNPVHVLSYSTGQTYSSDYSIPIENVYKDPTTPYTGLTPQNERILYYNTIRPDMAGGKLAFWLQETDGEYQYTNYGYSEIMEYYIRENDCLSDPVHLLFLNRQGVWDTYTFDKKALETKNLSRKTYGQGGVRDLSNYSQLSTNRRKTIYDQQITEVMNVSSWYLSDNDKQIVEDLFMSPEVYIIKEHDWTDKGEKTYNPYLLPVNLTTNSITEYKNQYNKTVQYNFNLEYTPINEYKTQG